MVHQRVRVRDDRHLARAIRKLRGGERRGESRSLPRRRAARPASPARGSVVGRPRRPRDPCRARAERHRFRSRACGGAGLPRRFVSGEPPLESRRLAVVHRAHLDGVAPDVADAVRAGDALHPDLRRESAGFATGGAPRARVDVHLRRGDGDEDAVELFPGKVVQEQARDLRLDAPEHRAHVPRGGAEQSALEALVARLLRAREDVPRRRGRGEGWGARGARVGRARSRGWVPRPRPTGRGGGRGVRLSAGGRALQRQPVQHVEKLGPHPGHRAHQVL